MLHSMTSEKTQCRNELLGTFGKMETSTQSYVEKIRYIKIVGYCPAGEHLNSIRIIESGAGTIKRSHVVQSISKIDRYVVATPQLTESGRNLSITNNILLMAPGAGSIHKRFEQLDFAEWINCLKFLSLSVTTHAIATPEFWNTTKENQS